MFHSPDLVKQVIKAQSLTRLIAFEVNSQDRIHTIQGTPGELMDGVDYLMSVIPGPFRVECGTENDVVAKGGKAGVSRAPFVWKLYAGKESAPPTPVHLPAPAPELKMPQGYVSSEQLATLLQLEQLKAQLHRQTHCMHDVPYTRDCPACTKEEEEEEEPEQQAATTVSKETVTEVRELVTIVRDVFREFRGMGKPDPTKAITGPVDESMNDDDRHFWRAICRMRESAAPEQVSEYKEWLLKNYGDDAAKEQQPG